ncbi:MAG: molybdopterin-synthase adenylyltransferase MoeB [Candidatus Poseidoniaceae archaeon]|jgi:adenylyltransferase/sulfurtransferase|tara:strand:- start:789 stop:1952 length:1164 start_codon:yes stop_codon:yes gene_type:complete
MDSEERFSRHFVLPGVGIEGQQKLSNANVLVVGAGGLGSPVLLYLAAAGVGRIGVIDDDTVALSNLQRQIIHSTERIGQKKVTSAGQRLNELNDEVEVVAYDTRLTPDNALRIMSEGWDLVVDGTDNIPTRYLVDDVCSLLNLPWVYGSIYRFEGQVSVFNFKGGPTYRDLFTTAPPAGAVPSCSEGGVLGVLPGVIGSLQANEVLKMILGLGEVLNGRLLLYDAEQMQFNTLTFSHDTTRPPVSDLEEVSAMFESPEWCAVADPKRSIQVGGASADSTMFQSISMADFIAQRNEGWSPFVLDVRSDLEYRQARVASCDHQVSHESVTSNLEELPKDRDILLYCKSGMRSQTAAMLLIQAGLDGTKLYNLEGGILGWHAALPNEIVK